MRWFKQQASISGEVKLINHKDEKKSAGDDPVTLHEVAQIARRKLPKNVWDYYAGGSDDQIAVTRNATAFNRLYICPRVLRDVTSVNTGTTLFGTKYPVPFGIAPSAMQKLIGGNGEIDMARASANVGINMTLSSQSTSSLEDVMQARGNEQGMPPFWFQIYLKRDLSLNTPLIRRAEAAGYEALVLTVDTPVLGNRINERKIPLALPAGLRLANIESEDTPEVRKPTFNRLLMDARTARQAEDIILSEGDSMHSASLTWESTISFLRSVTSMKIILKGIMTPEDAYLAVKHGADAIVVSNHGGRQLDSVASTIEALPEIAEAVSGKIPILLDGGITRGSDIFKALALGADFVLIGRPALWGLSFNDQKGVETVYHILERELSRTMALAGVNSVADIVSGLIAVTRENSFGLARL